MLLIDDLLFLPAKGFLAVFKKIHELAEAEISPSTEKLQADLRNARLLFETNQISKEEYQRQENEILRKLNAQRQKNVP